jgi:DNA-binding transcriptional MerR regulator/effector-binding domain-containing protein
MFSIGEFSKVTGLTVKTLRFYHEEGLLTPAFVDPQTGYRYYDPAQIETARAIVQLRDLEFSLDDIKELLRHKGDDEGLLESMRRQRSVLQERIDRFRKAVRAIDQYIAHERQAQAMSSTSAYEVVEKTIDPVLIGGIRMKGRYSDCGKAFARLGRSLGRYIAGKPLMLHYDHEYKEEDADFEPAMPLRVGANTKAKGVDGVSVRELPGGRAATLIHKGPYDTLGHSYAKILQYLKSHNYTPQCPSREVYLKGPGMIFKGNPKNYLTEIQMLIE